MARYRIQIVDQMLAYKPQYPEGCALLEQLETGDAGKHWWLFLDPAAPEGLEGKDVALTLRRSDDGAPVIAERHAIVTHLCPQDDDGGLMPCCEMTPWEVPRSDKITEDKELVTCGGAP